MLNFKSLTLFCGSLLAVAQSQAETRLLSPDGSQIAVLNEFGEGKEALIGIAKAADPKLIVAEKDMRSTDGGHGRTIVRRAWSPNSKYFVVSTSSSGGHSPWKFSFIVYRVADNKFFNLYDLKVVQNSGSIINDEINFKNNGDILEVKIAHGVEEKASTLSISLIEAGTQD